MRDREEREAWKGGALCFEGGLSGGCARGGSFESNIYQGFKKIIAKFIKLQLL